MQKPSTGTTKYTTTALAVLAMALLATTAGAGNAAAGEPTEIATGIASCEGLSPHILDSLHKSDLRVSQDGATGVVDVSIRASDTWWGYRSHPSITWTNLATGASGALTGKSYRLPQFTTVPPFTPVGISYENVSTGSGPVRFDLSVTNDEGLFPVPTITCTGTVDVG